MRPSHKRSDCVALEECNISIEKNDASALKRTAPEKEFDIKSDAVFDAFDPAGA